MRDIIGEEVKKMRLEMKKLRENGAVMIKPTWVARYAVVKDGVNKVFHRWHESEDLAIEEAKRLAAKEQASFIVLKEIGEAYLAMNPVEFQRAL